MCSPHSCHARRSSLLDDPSLEAANGLANITIWNKNATPLPGNENPIRIEDTLKDVVIAPSDRSETETETMHPQHDEACGSGMSVDIDIAHKPPHAQPPLLLRSWLWPYAQAEMQTLLRVPCRTESWTQFPPSQFLEGDWVDVMDSKGGWYTASILEVHTHGIKVHYKGWSRSRDEFVKFRPTNRLAPAGSGGPTGACALACFEVRCYVSATGLCTKVPKVLINALSEACTDAD